MNPISETNRSPAVQLLHSAVTARVDFDQFLLAGYVDHTIKPLTDNIRGLRLHIAFGSTVSAVFLNSDRTRHGVTKAGQNFSAAAATGEDSVHTLSAFSASFKLLSSVTAKGLLAVEIPQHFIKTSPQQVSTTHPNTTTTTTTSYQPFVLRIFFEVPASAPVLTWVTPHKEAFPRRPVHMYSNTGMTAESAWFPTIDSPTSRPIADFTLSGPEDMVIIGPGSLTSRELNESTGAMTWSYSVTTPCVASALPIAAGGFEIVPDPNNYAITHFCLPGRVKDTQYCSLIIPSVLSWITAKLGLDLPYGSYKQVFVDELSTARPDAHANSYAATAILSTHLLHDETIIDQTIPTRIAQARALISQWFGVYIGPKTAPDLWLQLGIVEYLTGLFREHHQGMNDYEWYLAETRRYVIENDNKGIPLYATDMIHPAEFIRTPFFAKKAHMVLVMIEKRIGREAVLRAIRILAIMPFAGSLETAINMTTRNTKATPSVVGLEYETERLQKEKEKAEAAAAAAAAAAADGSAPPPPPPAEASSAKTGSGKDDTLFTFTTGAFISLLETLSGAKLSTFMKDWVYQSGSPMFSVGFWFNRKRHQTEMAIRQTVTPNASTRVFHGNIVIRLYELEGTFDHEVAIEDDALQFSFACQSKHRRARRKAFMFENGERIEIELARINDTPLIWLRLDPGLTWLTRIEWRKPEFMWIHQLQADRHVATQAEAAEALADFGSSVVAIRMLYEVLRNERLYHRVREAAAISLGKCANAETNWVALDHLFAWFKSKFYSKADDSGFRSTPSTGEPQIRPHAFGNFPLYYVQRAVIRAMAHVRTPEGNTPSDVVAFLLDLLRVNDNSLNAYSDAYYVADVISTLAQTQPSDAEDYGRILKQLTRYLKFEKLIPSYHNVVTSAALKAMSDLAANGGVPVAVAMKTFEDHMSYVHYLPVRIAALTALRKRRYPSIPFIHACLDLIQTGATLPLGTVTGNRTPDDFICALMKLLLEPDMARDDSKWGNLPPVPTEKVTRTRMGKFFASLSAETEEAQKLCRRLWVLMHSMSACASPVLRLWITELFQLYYGLDVPGCFGGPRKSKVRFSYRGQAVREGTTSEYPSAPAAAPAIEAPPDTAPPDTAPPAAAPPAPTNPPAVAAPVAAPTTSGVAAQPDAVNAPPPSADAVGEKRGRADGGDVPTDEPSSKVQRV